MFVTKHLNKFCLVNLLVIYVILDKNEILTAFKNDENKKKNIHSAFDCTCNCVCDCSCGCGGDCACGSCY